MALVLALTLAFGFSTWSGAACLRVANTLGSQIESVDGRTQHQWLKAAIEYCRWRSGIEWRKTSQLNDPERLYYVHGVRKLTHILHTPEAYLLNPQLEVERMEEERQRSIQFKAELVAADRAFHCQKKPATSARARRSAAVMA